MPCHVCGNWMGPPGVPPWAFPMVPAWPHLDWFWAFPIGGCWLWSERCGGWICLCTLFCYRLWCRADLRHMLSMGGGWGERLLLNTNIYIHKKKIYIYIYIYIYISGLLLICPMHTYIYIYMHIYIYIYYICILYFASDSVYSAYYILYQISYVLSFLHLLSYIIYVI